MDSDDMLTERKNKVIDYPRLTKEVLKICGRERDVDTEYLKKGEGFGGFGKITKSQLQ